jgi:hypothetical protein
MYVHEYIIICSVIRVWYLFVTQLYKERIHVLNFLSLFIRLFHGNALEDMNKEHGERTVYTILEFFNFLQQHSMVFLNFLLHFFLVSFFLIFLAHGAIISNLQYTVSQKSSRWVCKNKCYGAEAQRRGAKIKLPPGARSENTNCSYGSFLYLSKT